LEKVDMGEVWAGSCISYNKKDLWQWMLRYKQDICSKAGCEWAI
jgi:hypothetical protein